MNKKQINILGFSVDTSINNLSVNASRMLINTINAHSYCVAKNVNLFREALQNSDILIPDGISIVWAAKTLSGARIKRIAGADLHDFLLGKLNPISGKVFYLGSSMNTLQKIEDRIVKEYPQIQFASYSPPYKPEFTEEDNYEMIKSINAFQPNVVFVGMTAPKQEIWAYTHKEQLNTNIIASIGAVFDFYAGTVKRAPEWMQKSGLEWLHRLLSNPSRMWKRYIIGNTEFIIDVVKLKLKRN